MASLLPEYQIQATLNGLYRLTEIIFSDHPVVTTYEIPLLTPLSSYLSGTGKSLAEDFISQSLLNRYSSNLLPSVRSSIRSLEFTLMKEGSEI